VIEATAGFGSCSIPEAPGSPRLITSVRPRVSFQFLATVMSVYQTSKRPPPELISSLRSNLNRRLGSSAI